jgi:hypothetical protein
MPDAGIALVQSLKLPDIKSSFLCGVLFNARRKCALTQPA